MKTHQHHKQPKSREGSDDPSNLEEIDFIEHAIWHANDFLSGGPRFDFRHEGWPYLPKNLAEAVLDKARDHTREMVKRRKPSTKPRKKPEISDKERQRRRDHAARNHEANVGRKRSPETRERMRQARLRYLEKQTETD